MNNRIKVFRHTDLDGVGVGIVAKAFYGKLVDETPCENHEVDSKIMEFIEAGDYINYSLIIVGDISFSEEVAEIIDSHDNLRDRFLLVDHHKTALHLNKYPFAKVEVERSGLKASGTSSLYEILLESGVPVLDNFNKSALSCFVEKVRRYDTWEWSTIYRDEKAHMLNQLYYLVGPKDFSKETLKKLSAYKTHFFEEGEWTGLLTDQELTLLAVESKREMAYIESKLKRAKFGMTKDGKHVFTYVFAENYISTLGNILCGRLEVDFAVIIDVEKKKVSLRSIGDKCDVSVIAKKFDGGGHKNASGFHFELSHNKFIENVVFFTPPEKKKSKFLSLKAKVKKLFDKSER